MGREFELKFRATPEIQESIREKYGNFAEISMETTYFDTRERSLKAQHITLRRRMENGISVCTVKTPSANGGRGEWELNWPEPATMVEELCKLGAPKILASLTAGGIVPVCGAKFLRRAATLDLPGGQIELALDKGILTGGGKEAALCEVEVELKAGEDAIALDFARTLAAEFDLQPEKYSKFRRASALADEEPIQP